MFHRTLLVVALIAANLVATSATKSAGAMPNAAFAHLSEAEQRHQFNRMLAEVFSKAHVPVAHITRMQAIAWCESRGRPHVLPTGDLMRNQSGAFVGFLQVAYRVHAQAINRLRHEAGMDVLQDVHAYIYFTLSLYQDDRRRGGNGFRPWPACAQKTQAMARPPRNTGRRHRT
jgi:hypothetical protein